MESVTNRHDLRPRACGAAESPAEADDRAEAIRFVVGSVAHAQGRPDAGPVFRKLRPARDARNQFCLFLKPWATHPGARIGDLMALVWDQASARGLSFEEVAILPGPWLEAHGTMAAHYWRMNAFARAGAAALTPAARALFRQAFGERADGATILGGFELLGRFPAITPQRLERIWEETAQVRLAAGLSCARIAVRGETIFLVNGFVPNLMATYHHRHSVVVAFSIAGALGWSDARHRFVGDTDPAQAVAGSLRNLLLQRRAELGIDLRLGANGVHLSAGPLEALAELRRLMSPASPGDGRPAADFRFGRRLAGSFAAHEVEALLKNPKVERDGRETTLFDLTAGLDEEAAAALLVELRGRRLEGMPGAAPRARP